MLRRLTETELHKNAMNTLTNWRKITAETKLNKDTISENKHENKNVHDAESSRRSLQNLVNVYEYLGMELQVGKYLEDVSHLLYESTCKKKPWISLFAFADAADTWDAHSKLSHHWSQASVHGLCLTELRCCFLVGILLRGTQERTFKQNTWLLSELACSFNSTDHCLPRLVQLGTAFANT